SARSNHCTETRDYGRLAFFFSSRRRHTRSKRDWSSDVCSSELTPVWRSGLPGTTTAMPHPDTTPPAPRAVGRGTGEQAKLSRARSEERRVGKEGGCGGSRELCRVGG